MNAQAIVTGVLAITQRLTEILEAENRILMEHKPRHLERSREEKKRLSDAYAAEMEILRRNKSLLDHADQQDVATLKKISAVFNQTLESHKSLMFAAKETTEGMVLAIAEEVARRNAPVKGYGTDAELAAAGTPKPTSLALNQII